MFACAHHLPIFYAFVWLLSDNPRLTCPDPGAWNEVDPSVED